MNISRIEDWYKIPIEKLHHFGFGTLQKTYGSFFNALSKVYPEQAQELAFGQKVYVSFFNGILLHLAQ